jgi:hypothetical protein
MSGCLSIALRCIEGTQLKPRLLQWSVAGVTCGLKAWKNSRIVEEMPPGFYRVRKTSRTA